MNYIKGIVHFKMKILSSFSLSSCFKPACISFYRRTQRKIFWRMSVTKLEPLTSMVIFFPTMEVNGSSLLFV